ISIGLLTFVAVLTLQFQHREYARQQLLVATGGDMGPSSLSTTAQLASCFPESVRPHWVESLSKFRVIKIKVNYFDKESEYISCFPEVELLWIQSFKSNPPSWKNLGPLPNLRFIDLSIDDLSAEDLKEIGRQVRCNQLRIDVSKCGLQALDGLSSWSEMTQIRVNSAILSGQDILKIWEQCPHIDRLTLYECSIDSSAVQKLFEQKSLAELDLYDCSHLRLAADDIQMVYSELRKLSIHSYEGFDEMPATIAEFIGNSCNALEEVTMKSWEIPDGLVSKILVNNPRIRRIRIPWNSISATVVADLMSLEHLEEVVVSIPANVYLKRQNVEITEIRSVLDKVRAAIPACRVETEQLH
ncbi:MAG: hypothetical protein NT069_01240, partial [Planctomycetota bacterium]|nr:hypothetical protein [Planctomycetota bacterium]